MTWSFKPTTLPIFFGSGLALLIALEQVTRKRPNRANLLFSSVFLCCFVIIWGAGAVANRLPPREPWTIYLFFTAICLVGPLYWFYFNALLHPDKRHRLAELLHFVPALGAFLIETGFQGMPAAFKKPWLAEMFDDPPRHVMTLLVIAGALHAFSYLAYLLKKDLGLAWSAREVKTELRLLVVVNALAILGVMTLFVGFTLQIPFVFITGGNVLAILITSVFLGYNRYPDFLQLLKTRIEKERYEKSALNGVDTERVHGCLMELVEKERVYTESELNLKSLADRLSITPHQLSQFLNERLGLDFRSFLNAYRVRDAKKSLAEEPEKNILEICYEVGFGSKSTFNSVFKKETGLTPREFRDAALLSK